MIKIPLVLVAAILQNLHLPLKNLIFQVSLCLWYQIRILPVHLIEGKALRKL